jgi:hypothetical protein
MCAPPRLCYWSRQLCVKFFETEALILVVVALDSDVQTTIHYIHILRWAALVLHR